MNTLYKTEDHRVLLDLIPVGLLILDQDLRIHLLNKFAEKRIQQAQEDVISKPVWDVFPALIPEHTLQAKMEETFRFTISNDSYIGHTFTINEKDFSGFILMFEPTSLLEEVTKELDSFKSLNADLKAVLDTSYDVTYVSDGNGMTIRVGSACEKLWGLKENEMVGKSVYELEREGVFQPSVTRLVLERKEKVSIVQTTKTGRRLVVIGTPIKDEKGDIIRVVNASRDITEVSQLQSEVEMLKQLTEGYRQELMELRSKDEVEKNIVYRSDKMRKVVTFAQNIAKVDSPVLLLGESGVGKEMMASFIHRWSPRHKCPFIMVNCGAIPENFLEQELFGNEILLHLETERKIGLLEMANGGTLFIDEIEQLPMTLQVKLLRVLQEKKLKKVDPSITGSVNVRIITASNIDLESQVQSGKFRRDLFYQLNVVPIHIPPLRERREDILRLILHFTEQINQKYKMKKKFNPHLLKKLQDYSWPGNVRELQNIIERLLVTSEGEWIEAEHLPDHIMSSISDQRSIQINKILPLKQAVEQLEVELLKMAQNKYASTTKIAEVLGVNQSTISRKLQYYHMNKGGMQ